MRFDSRVGEVTGRRHASSEDACFAGEYALAVADGVGGAGPAALAASRAAIDAIASLPTRTIGGVVDAIKAVDVSVASLHGATTLCALVITGSSLTVANVGDSRAQRVTGAGLVAVTQDHNDAVRRARDGVSMSEEEERLRRTLLYNFLGSRHATIDLFELAIRVGDRVLISTDGLHDHFASSGIHTAVHPELPLDEAREALLRLVGDAPPDDVTFVLADVCSEPA